MQKRLVAVIVAGTMVLSLGACGSSDSSDSSADDSSAEETSDETTDEESSESSGESYHIEMVVKHTDEHFQRVMAGAQAYADENGIDIDFVSPTSQSDYDGQQNAIETSLNTDEYDAMIIAPLQSETVATLVEGTEKVILAVDTDFTSDYKSSFIGTGNEDAAYSGAEKAAELAAEKGIEDITAVILTGTQGDETHEARKSGFTAAIEDAGGEVIDIQYTDSNSEKVTTAMEGIIQKYPDGVDIIMCTDDVQGSAAAKIISESGNSAYTEDAIFVSFDGNQETISLLQEGQITVEIAQLGYQMGYLAVEAAVAVLNGEEVDSYIDSGVEVLTADNVDEYVAEMTELGLWDEDAEE